MSRPIGYRAAIRWLALNDDCQWCIDDEEAGSVSAALVADIYGVDDEKVRRDLKKVLAEEGRTPS